jgi:hypothetical protein
MSPHPAQIWLMTSRDEPEHPLFLVRDVADDTLFLMDRDSLLTLISEGGIWVQYSSHNRNG